MADTQLLETLTESEIAAIEAEVAHLPNRQAAAIDALKLVQAQRGWISDQTLAAIARQLEMSTAELDGIATFYNLIFRQPVGKKVILFCDSVSCYVMGAEAVCTRLKDKLGIGYGETTADGQYTLLPVTCLGDCDHAPAMMIGEDLHHDLTPENVGGLV